MWLRRVDQWRTKQEMLHGAIFCAFAPQTLACDLLLWPPLVVVTEVQAAENIRKKYRQYHVGP